VGGSTVASHQVRIERVSDSSQIHDWATHTSGQAITGLNLATNTQYRILVRALDSLGNIGTPHVGVIWTSFDNPCPINYVLVPALPPYTASNFCVAKYEMKNVGGVATSQPDLTPWVSIQRGATATTASSAWKACRDLGAKYDLISNAQWQTIARNIENVGINWSGGSVGSGALNRGYSGAFCYKYIPSDDGALSRPSWDNSSSNGLVADTSDTNGCLGTLRTCSSTTWHEERRTHVLSNGQVIWDLAGNVWEWIRDDYSSLGVNPDIKESEFSDLSATNQALFGPSVSSYNSTQGMGQINMYDSPSGVLRGGTWDKGECTGIFTLMAINWSSGWPLSGFRCVFVP
jgi:hypothetical protein